MLNLLSHLNLVSQMFWEKITNLMLKSRSSWLGLLQNSRIGSFKCNLIWKSLECKIKWWWCAYWLGNSWAGIKLRCLVALSKPTSMLLNLLVNRSELVLQVLKQRILQLIELIKSRKAWTSWQMMQKMYSMLMMNSLQHRNPIRWVIIINNKKHDVIKILQCIFYYY